MFHVVALCQMEWVYKTAQQESQKPEVLETTRFSGGIVNSNKKLS